MPGKWNFRYNDYLEYRNTYYWDRAACDVAYGDYSKARLYHFTHTGDLATTSGCLESKKAPLEGRVWYDYPGQTVANIIGSSTLPTHAGRVLDDGSTQLYTYAYNGFGRITGAIDPQGRTMTFIYDTNGIDLLEVRQTRHGNNQLLAKMAYNSQHRPVAATDAAGQVTTFTYNARGQLLSLTDPLHEATTCSYDANGYLLSIDGPLPGTNDTVSATYDFLGRVGTLTDVSGYTLAFNYDDLDRITRVTFPDSTFRQYSYSNLDCVALQDRSGRLTSLGYDNLRQLTQMTDALGRTTRFQWCRCGSPKSIIDPMGRMTSWITDVQGRTIAKQYADGSQENYVYENTTGRLQQMIDQKQQTTFLTYNLDNTIQSVSYGNARVSTPNVTYTWDPDYLRVTSMQDGIGATTYSYNPITPSPMLGAGKPASVTGPLANSTITWAYDALGRPVREVVDGEASTLTFDAANRITAVSNALGSFSYSYDGNSTRMGSMSFPNGQNIGMTYGNSLQDNALLQIASTANAAPISQFVYTRDLSRDQITAWSQQAGSQPPSVFSFGYDAANQLVSALVTNSGTLANPYGYSYDSAGNRLTETIAGSTTTATYNSLNQLSATANAAVNSRTNQWDARNRLVAVTVGQLTTQFGYDGASRLAYVRQLQNGSQVSLRYFVWCHNRICEERDASGTDITKRFYAQGVLLQTGTNAGAYYYTRDHLGSIRELTDAAGNVRARYSYDPFGRRTKVSGDVGADFGFAGMFWSSETSLAITRFRAYDPNLGRWLSRNPLKNAEMMEGPNLYAYVINNPVNLIDPSGKDPPGLGLEVLEKLVSSAENTGAPTGTGANLLKLLSEGGQASTEAAETVAEKEVASPAEQALADWAGELISRQAANSCVEAGPLAVSFAVGVGIGAGLDYEFDLNGKAANFGLKVEEETGSRFWGGVATLESVVNPGAWIGAAIFGD